MSLIISLNHGGVSCSSPCVSQGQFRDPHTPTAMAKTTSCPLFVSFLSHRTFVFLANGCLPIIKTTFPDFLAVGILT